MTGPNFLKLVDYIATINLIWCVLVIIFNIPIWIIVWKHTKQRKRYINPSEPSTTTDPGLAAEAAAGAKGIRLKI